MAHITAAGFPVLLGDRELTMTPLSALDIEEINNWFRSELIRLARLSLDSSMTQAERDEVLSVAMRESQRSHWMSAEGQRIVKTPAGLARVMWQSFKHRHPDLTVAEVQTLLMNPDNMAVVNATFKEANEIKDKIGKEPAAQASKKRSPAARRHRQKKNSTRR